MTTDLPRRDLAGDPKLRRLDERLGLAVSRAGASPRTLVTYARDHVSVRTPSRPDYRDGNTLDLERPPAPDELDAWIARFAETTGRLGVRHVQLRWETPLPQDAPPVEPEPDPQLAAALAERGVALHATTVLLLAELVAPPDVSADLVAVTPPSLVAGAGGRPEVSAEATPVEVERRWHAVGVLRRYSSGETPEEWRTGDADFRAWSVEVLRELAAADRATIWLALRHGTPVAEAVLLHDRQGLATVEDVVVHPVHRRLGIASAITHRAVASHLADHPGTRVGIGAEPGSTADRLYRRLGFRPHATVWTALRV